MLEILGRGYVCEHCNAALRRERIHRRYRAYIADALLLIGENAARLLRGGRLMSRWKEGEVNHSAEDPDAIANQIMRYAGLKRNTGNRSSY